MLQYFPKYRAILLVQKLGGRKKLSKSFSGYLALNQCVMRVIIKHIQDKVQGCIMVTFNFNIRSILYRVFVESSLTMHYLIFSIS